MRRGGRYSVRRADAGGEQGFWPSYADMMSAVSLILFFLMLLSYIQNLITGNDLQNTQELLADTQAQVEEAQSKLTKLNTELDNLNLDLTNKQAELDDYAKQISEQTDKISAQSELISDQQAYLIAANDELTQMRSKMQSIAVLRLSILNQIKDSIVDVMGDSSKVSIGDNGNIILSEGILFDLGSSDIKPDSQPVLDELIEVFSAFLSNEENSQYVDSIVISGHTDSTGTEEDNRVLSTDRANSVLNYLFVGEGGELEKYSRYFCAAGYGETRPVADNDSAEGQAANRRIEISIILKDESVLKIVEDYLAMELPDKAQSLQDAAAESGAQSASTSAAPEETQSPSSGGFLSGLFGRN